MTRDRTGQSLIASGAVLFAIALGFAATGHAVGFDSGELGSLILMASLTAFAAGAGLVAGSGSVRRSGQVGLGLLAIGLFVLLGLTLVGAASQSDPLESLPLVILSFAAVVAIVVGVIVTTVAFAPRRAGRAAEPK